MPAFIDRPTSEIEDPQVVMLGWVAADNPDIPVSVVVNGVAVPYQRHDRPDVRSALPAFAYTSGILARFDLRHFRQQPSLVIELHCGPEQNRREFSLSARMITRCEEDARLRRASRDFCLEHIRCSQCGAGRADIRFDRGSILCQRCNATFRQPGAAINMISEDLRLQANVVSTENVSSNPYAPSALDLIERTTGRGGWVLDCGAGLRPERLRNVINLEIVDYASTDVLAVGESLPFADDTFDAALSLAVLEHVRNPFACAKELLRVVKPGGEIIADVPFLQPLHGYPHHYYNMTALGLKNLFGDAEVLGLNVPLHGHPIFGVHWLLREYAAGLQGSARTEFEAMTVHELCGLDPAAFLTTAPGRELSAQAQAITACLNSIHLRKR